MKDNVKIEYINPLTEEQIKAIYNRDIEYLTKEQIIERYRDLLTKSDKKALDIE